MARRLACICAAIGCLACGDALLDERYRGEMLFNFIGRIDTAGLEFEFFDLRIGLFWLPYDPTTLGEAGARTTPLDDLSSVPGLGPNAALIEQSRIAYEVFVPGDFEINLFEAPPPAALGGRSVAYAVVAMYDDVDGDARYSPGERVGVIPSQLVVYSREALGFGDPANRTDWSLDAGYNITDLPFRCGAEDPIFEVDLDFDVVIGAVCLAETAVVDCGAGGTCLMPYGVCALDADAVTPGTAPPSMVLREVRRDGEPYSAWFQGCGVTADCQPSLVCVEGACLPPPLPALVLEPAIQMQPSCARYHRVEPTPLPVAFQ